MMSKDYIILGLMALSMGLCVWVMYLDGRVYDLQRYIDRRLK